MVKLNKIYTRTGDDGTTGLVTGGRVSKACPRVEAYGAVDEANAAIGMAIAEACRPSATAPTDRQLADLLRSVQHDLFDLGADLATPITPDPKHPPLRIVESQTKRLEDAIDRFNEKLEPLQSFVLPGGSPIAAALHLARTVVRRAERHSVLLKESGGAEAAHDEAIRYLNRLSDLLFVLCRVANDFGSTDVLWKPGKNRG